MCTVHHAYCSNCVLDSSLCVSSKQIMSLNARTRSEVSIEDTTINTFPPCNLQLKISYNDYHPIKISNNSVFFEISKCQFRDKKDTMRQESHIVWCCYCPVQPSWKSIHSVILIKGSSWHLGGLFDV